MRKKRSISKSKARTSARHSKRPTGKAKPIVPYFMLECFQPRDWEDGALFRRAPSLPGVRFWTTGARFPNALPALIEFELQLTHSDRLYEMHNSHALIITRRLLTALREAGVDNLDVYPAVIRHEGTGMVNHDYVAVNVIGVISAADLGSSKVVGGMQGSLIDVDFDAVALDENQVHGALMFRLAENTNAILVHEKVKEALLAKGFDMLSFIPPEKWMG